MLFLCAVRVTDRRQNQLVVENQDKRDLDLLVVECMTSCNLAMSVTRARGGCVYRYYYVAFAIFQCFLGAGVIFGWSVTTHDRRLCAWLVALL